MQLYSNRNKTCDYDLFGIPDVNTVLCSEYLMSILFFVVIHQIRLIIWFIELQSNFLNMD
jgi:hypothetical protein